MSDFASMKIADLKKELKAKGLPVSGNKQELVDRLVAADNTSLLDDDLDQEEPLSAEALKEAEDELKKQSDLNGEANDVSPAKKLKTSDDKENKNELSSTNDDEKAAEDDTTKSTADLIKARAERFGGFQSDEAKKAARAERFGISATSTAQNKKGTKLGDAPPVDIETLKKRADRFGSTVSPHVKQAEVSEAIKRRQERFGVVTKNEKAPKVSTNMGANSVVLNEQMQKRKERFGL